MRSPDTPFAGCAALRSATLIGGWTIHSFAGGRAAFTLLVPARSLRFPMPPFMPGHLSADSQGIAGLSRMPTTSSRIWASRPGSAGGPQNYWSVLHCLEGVRFGVPPMHAVQLRQQAGPIPLLLPPSNASLSLAPISCPTSCSLIASHP